MDYCHACRRHLNGALACAGCGTPVERLRYDTPQAPPHPAPHEGAEAPDPYGAGWPYAPEAYETQTYAPEPYATAPGSYAPAPEPYAPAPEASVPEEASASGPLAPEHVYELDVVVPPRAAGGRSAGRAATRRGKERSGRSGRGRTVAVSALGLVLAAGSLGLAKAVFEEPEEKGGAATAVEELEVTETPLPPELPTRSPSAEDAGEAEGGEEAEGGDRADGASAAPASPTGRPRQISTGTGGGSGTGAPAAPGGGGGSGDGSGPGAGAGTGSGSGTGAGATPTGRPSSAAPSSPAPSVPAVTADPQEENPGGTPSASGPPTAPASGGASPSAPSSPRPTTAAPTPEPSETCTRFLWWCV
ncbi:SCO2400 family protein [Streptomyces roseolus]